jgi:uncharacterized protein YjiS (DUF1127 family)
MLVVNDQPVDVRGACCPGAVPPFSHGQSRETPVLTPPLFRLRQWQGELEGRTALGALIEAATEVDHMVALAEVDLRWLRHRRVRRHLGQLTDGLIFSQPVAHRGLDAAILLGSAFHQLPLSAIEQVY